MSQKYSLRKVGRPNTLQYRIFIEENGVPVSPFHDIPLYADAQGTVLNMVVEIPRWTNSKFEISRDEHLNPIMQDAKDGKLRYVKNSFPFHGYIWNYGALPQTWEDPSFINPDTKAKGDNDPIDACEIGQRVGHTGEIKQVKVLGIMALLDDHETDWKVIVIDINDPLAPSLNDIEDVETHFPGLIDGTRRWFKAYKVPDGKPENKFALSEECRNKNYAMDVIRDAAKAWERLINGDADPGSISLANVSMKHSPNYVSSKELRNTPAAEDLEQAPFDSTIDKWFFNAKYAQHKM